MARHHHQPCRDATLFLVKRGGDIPGLEKCLLNNLLGSLALVKNARGHPQKTWCNLVVEIAQRLRITLGHPCEQIFLSSFNCHTG